MELKKRKLYRLTFVGIGFLFVGIVLGLWLNSSLQSTLLSDTSSRKFSELNRDYGMFLVPLTADSTQAVDRELLLQANLLSEMDNVLPSDAQGLIVNFESETDSLIFLLQPRQHFSEEQLEEMSEIYKDQIPEFNSIEMDQWISMESETSPTDLEVSPYGEEVTSIVEVLETSYVPTVAIIDSGYDDSHPLFTENSELVFLEGWDFVHQDNDPDDQVTHGTHIAGLVTEGGALKVHSYKVYEEQGKLSYLIQAMDKAITDDVDLINLSLGVQKPSDVLEGLVADAHEKGILVVTAAGNFSTDSCFYPACYEGSLAVGAVGVSGLKNSKSNFGEWVDVAGPGMPLYSSFPDGKYGYLSGTSQAAAVVSRVLIEFFRTNPDPTEEEVWDYLNSFEKVPRGKLKDLPKLF